MQNYVVDSTLNTNNDNYDYDTLMTLSSILFTYLLIYLFRLYKITSKRVLVCKCHNFIARVGFQDLVWCQCACLNGSAVQ
jgi:hypothetical protein